MFTGLHMSLKNLDHLAEGFIGTYRPTGCDFLLDGLTYQIASTVQAKFIGILEFLKNISRSVEIIFLNDGAVDG